MTAQPSDFPIISNPYEVAAGEPTDDWYLPTDNDGDFKTVTNMNSEYVIGTAAVHGVGKQLAIDFGCGAGRMTRELAFAFEKVVGMDAFANTLDFAKRKLSDLNNVECVHADDSRYNDTADLVLCLQVMQHNSYVEQINILKRVGELLRADGLACIHLPKLIDGPRRVITQYCMLYSYEQVNAFGQLFSDFWIDDVEFAPEWRDYFLWARKPLGSPNAN